MLDTTFISILLVVGWGAGGDKDVKMTADDCWWVGNDWWFYPYLTCCSLLMPSPLLSFLISQKATCLFASSTVLDDYMYKYNFYLIYVNLYLSKFKSAGFSCQLCFALSTVLWPVIEWSTWTNKTVMPTILPSWDTKKQLISWTSSNHWPPPPRLRSRLKAAWNDSSTISY